METKRIGTINGEEIICFNVHGEYQGEINRNPLYSLAEVYNFIKEEKEADKRLHTEDTYSVSIQTKTSIYYGYTIRKYKNKLKLVSIKPK